MPTTVSLCCGLSRALRSSRPSGFRPSSPMREPGISSCSRCAQAIATAGARPPIRQPVPAVIPPLAFRPLHRASPLLCVLEAPAGVARLGRGAGCARCVSPAASAQPRSSIYRRGRWGAPLSFQSRCLRYPALLSMSGDITTRRRSAVPAARGPWPCPRGRRHRNRRVRERLTSLIGRVADIGIWSRPFEMLYYTEEIIDLDGVMVMNSGSSLTLGFYFPSLEGPITPFARAHLDLAFSGPYDALPFSTHGLADMTWPRDRAVG